MQIRKTEFCIGLKHVKTPNKSLKTKEIYFIGMVFLRTLELKYLAPSPNKIGEGAPSPFHRMDKNRKQGEKELDEHLEEIFKPRDSLPRTPPGKKQRMIDEALKEAKQTMVETVRDIMNKSAEKLRDDLNRTILEGSSGEESEEAAAGVGKKAGDARSMVAGIGELVDTIQKATTRYSGGKIQFNRDEQLAVSNSLQRIMTITGRMGSRMAQLETREHLLSERMRELEKRVSVHEREREILMAVGIRLEGMVDWMNRFGNEWRDMKATVENLMRGKPKPVQTRTSERSAERTTENTSHEPSEAEGTDRPITAGTGADTDMETDAEFRVASVSRRRRRRTRNRGRRTYASELNRNRGNEQRQGWTTPTAMEEEIVVLKADDSTPTARIVGERLRNGGVMSYVEAITRSRNGVVVLKGKDDEGRQMIREALQNESRVNVKEGKKPNPHVMLTGVEKGYGDEVLVDLLLEQNPSLVEGLAEEDIRGMLVRKRRECRVNRWKKNIIVEVNPTLFRRMMRMEVIKLDLADIYVEEHSSVAVCFKCCHFGHTSKICKQDPACNKCGGMHEGRDCRGDRGLNCINCKRAGVRMDVRRHSALDPKCPVYMRRVELQRRRTNYVQGPSN
ncbi:uncharacterized protein [Leptinotarsa decemlineata]|uniref:uncharacterized protein n=1 Tax=Leptinotarsa decemlineata TaxID=7539 RepID=UPI003D3065C1